MIIDAPEIARISYKYGCVYSGYGFLSVWSDG